jgi:type II restriction/modification system DNA methylase subunit YeeA
MALDPLRFVRKWNASQLTERSAAPQHFRDLCEMLGVPHPTEVDEIGASYTFEKRVAKTGGGEGYADVWKRGWFAWEYKSKGGDLRAAYKQLNEYHEALENPPLLVVCDFVRFEVHTKFENTPPRVYAFTLDDLLSDKDTATCAIPPQEVLRHVFGDYNPLRPSFAAVRVTRATALDFLRLAQQLDLERALDTGAATPHDIARFLMRLVFCLFADSVGLLPNRTFRRLIENDRLDPVRFNRKLPVLFQAMSEERSFFGTENIPYFNGGLFTDNSTIELNGADLGILHSASQHDWSHIEPAIFGTLFETALNQEKRDQLNRSGQTDVQAIGVHYTSPEDILLLVDPVVMQPLRRRWEAVQASVLAALEEEKAEEAADAHIALVPRGLRPNRPAQQILHAWAAELSAVRILDPACGSGNFLYVTLKRILDLWHEARVFGSRYDLRLETDPMPSPDQLFGIELNFYAHEIASLSVWIGFLQWKHDHNIHDTHTPLLRKLDNIQHADAILCYDPSGKPDEPTWPSADYIVSNPPFLGGKLLRRELGDKYIDDLFALYRDRVKAESDLVVYWFEKARHQLELNEVERVGLLATQGIRGGANRNVLERIQQTGRIFWAWSDRKWMLEGAAAHVSMVAFERATEPRGPSFPASSERVGYSRDARTVLSEPPQNSPTVSAPEPAASHATHPSAEGATTYQPGPKAQVTAHPEPLRAEGPTYYLDGQPVHSINPDLTSGSNTASALRLKENEGLCFMGTTKVGPFDIDAETARKMLSAPVNPNGRPNADVVKPWINSLDVTRRPRNMFIVDFGTDTTEAEAALYQMPFEYLKHHVKPTRTENKRATYATHWWIHGEARGDLRGALRSLSRFIATPSLSKHRFFVWTGKDVVPDHQLFAFPREDDYFFGVLHSSIHEIWALTMGTQLESRPRYTPNSMFDTFPFPWPPGTEPSEAESPLVKAIADAARALVQQRDAWLNPPGASEEDLKKRTLTKLYNDRAAGKITWLDNLHRTLDEAVFAAYGWPSNLTTQEILARLLALNHQRAAAQPPKSDRHKAKRISAPPKDK